MASVKEFKVIIAGGGIAGLTLANMLEKFHLDYVVLEGHSEISPAVGASIGMFPNGLRILDQLGCYKPIKELFGESIPYEKTYTRDEKGQVIYDMPGFFSHLEKRAVRGVMTALGNKLEPGYFDSKEPESVPCYYCCSFGIARGVPGWTSGEQHVGTGRGRSQLVVSGPEDRVYWFMFKKLPETKYGKDIPWYSKEDEAEFVKRNWTHKPNPIGGQGANGAMESCAELMNALLRTRDSRGGNLTSLTDEEIESIFNQTRSARHVRAVEIVKRAHDQQSLFAYENPAISTIVCKFAQPLSGGESLLSLLSGAYVAGSVVEKLPIPYRPRAIPFRDELPAQPIDPTVHGVVKKVFIGSMGLLYFVSRKAFRLPFSEIDSWSKSAMTLKWFGNTRASNIFNLFISTLAVPITDADPSARVQLWNFLPQLISPLVIYAIEASRTGNQATPLALPLLFSVGMQIQGIGGIGPLYSILSALFSYEMPTGRAVPVEVVKSLVPAVTFGFVVPTIMALAPTPDANAWHNWLGIWQFAPHLFNVLAMGISAGLRMWNGKRQPKKEDGQTIYDRYKRKDVESLKMVYTIRMATSRDQHLQDLPNPFKAEWGLSSLTEKLAVFFRTCEAAKAALCVIAGQFLVGSGATWAGLWYWREDKIAGLMRE
ncbi:hypothetical protein BHE90_001356 [Fusarium euwallaceae]|uniref:FAD-binding domain-containing protein n=1 Tax=Fusarium euwallaceae TaxID=1147111 RepID=A0A430M7S3_9HYPO|nr:hypothetical protein BHE90_001356 [Fusarium euwallaceae]